MEAERYVCPHNGPGVMAEGGGLSREAAAELVEEGRLGAQDGHALGSEVDLINQRSRECPLDPA